MRTVRIALVQTEIIQGDAAANLRRGEAVIIEAAQKGADIVCLPELFNTGYYLSASRFIEMAEPIDGQYVNALRRLAKEHAVHIISGFAESEKIPGRIYNSAVLIDDEGEIIGCMRKVNLWGEEKLKFRAGNKFPVFDTKLGKIGLLICYDVESPEPSRILALKGAELVFVPAMWDIPAAFRWDLSLSANALFNLMFVAGCNPVGNDGCGRSQVRAPGGELVAAASEEKEEILFCDIDLGDVLAMRGELPYFNDLRPDIFPAEITDRY